MAIRSAALARAQDNSIILHCLIDDRVEYKHLTRRELLDLVERAVSLLLEDEQME